MKEDRLKENWHKKTRAAGVCSDAIRQQVQTVDHRLYQEERSRGLNRMKKELTFRNLVRVGDKYVPIEELTEEQRKDFGNYVRRRPMEALGYIVEEAG